MSFFSKLRLPFLFVAPIVCAIFFVVGAKHFWGISFKNDYGLVTPIFYSLFYMLFGFLNKSYMNISLKVPEQKDLLVLVLYFFLLAEWFFLSVFR